MTIKSALHWIIYFVFSAVVLMPGYPFIENKSEGIVNITILSRPMIMSVYTAIITGGVRPYDLTKDFMLAYENRQKQRQAKIDKRNRTNQRHQLANLKPRNM